MAIGRRMLIAGATIAGLGAAAGVVVFRAVQLGDRSDRSSEAFLEAVAADYRNGRVVVVAGWILSETEVAAFEDTPALETTTSSVPDAT